MTKTGKTDIELQPVPQLLLEPVDDQTVREVRERRAATVRLLWENRRFLLKTTLACLVISIVLTFVISKRYTSTARLMPPDQSSGQGTAVLAALAGHASGSLGSLAENALGLSANGDLFVGVLSSDTVEDRIIQKFALQKIYRDRYIEDARKDLADHTTISADSKSGIITIEVTDHNAMRAAGMAQEYINGLNWVVTHLDTSSAHRERVFLDQRLTQVNASLETAEKQFSQFASQKGAVDISEQGKAMLTAVAGLQGQLIAAESELESLRQVYTDNNVRVRSMQARVNDVRQALQKFGGKNIDENTTAEQLYPSLRELPLLGVEYADLLRRTKVQEAAFEVLTQEDEMAKIEEAKEVPSVKVLDAPEVAQRISFPPRPLFISLGTLLGFAIAVAWVLGLSTWKLVDASDPRKVTIQRIWKDVHASVRRISKNGSSNEAEH
ncbi:MAG: Wzz/FepE/Etk N-terminal domain-containing protein [Candidatus Acidiferrales bacterium]